MAYKIRCSVLMLSFILAGGAAGVSDIGDFESPFTDVWDDSALWHFNEYVDTALTAGKMFTPDDDTAYVTRTADLALYDGTTQITSPSSMPKLVDPVAEGIGYPAGNTAFAKCISFNGVSNNAQVAMSKVQIDTANLLISCWIRLSSSYVVTADGTNHSLHYIDRWNQIVFRMVNTAAGVMQSQIVLWNAAGTVSYITMNYSSLGIDPKQWHHVAVRCIGNQAQFYVNGVLKSTYTLATQGLYPAPGLTIMYIGSRYTTSEAFPGYIDEVRVTKAVPSTGLTGYHKYDFNHDCAVDGSDLKDFADHWLDSGTGCPTTVLPMDFNNNCTVELADFAIFAQSWLFCSDVMDPSCAISF